MAVQIIDTRRLFILSTRNTSYVFHIDRNGRPVHLHYGGRVSGTEGLLSLEIRKGRSSFSPAPEGEEYLDSPDALMQEFSGFNAEITGSAPDGAGKTAPASGMRVTCPTGSGRKAGASRTASSFRAFETLA